MATAKQSIAIRGAGVVGLWQALLLARAGHAVTIYERSATPFADACSPYAGAMLAPRCEEESAEPIIHELGLRSIALWRESYPGTHVNGSLVVAQPRDQTMLDRFARMTRSAERLDRDVLAALEPDLGRRFSTALFYPGEAHLAPDAALDFLLNAVKAAVVSLVLGESEMPRGADLIIDCRGLAAKDRLPSLRGVRGERIVVRAHDVALARPARLLHPRFPLYAVPWGDGLFMIGATVVESEEAGPVTVRSALELLSAAYALDPAFGEAELVKLGAGARPAFPDNRPRIITAKGYIYVNGLYRHGF
ncbi:MAG: FAD-dependent oxidoreductase, partial [Actinomycetota bacterium]